MNMFLGLGWVSRHTRVTIADDQRLILKDDLETCHHNFDPPRRGWLPALVPPRSIILVENLKDIALTADFTCTSFR